ncbi:pimeloyl-ACP methyl ester carboxylesterase [Neisseria sp. HSC-16F19]|nr:alpha/beta hydrolase [Neisseria sp. HSC-16F19]MCP2040950.1 pimeloyl-ACP methyl ester carboxylesterase [Neisseria sp. HSC-16F19]
MRPLIHFVHANGLPAACYRPLFDALADGADVAAPPLIGMNPAYPVDNHWASLSREVADSIHTLGQGRPVIAVGHSMGAILSLLAARLQPQGIRQVIMLEPPLILGKEMWAVQAAKRFSPRLLDKLTPAGLAARRRDRWESRAAAAAALRTRGFFKELDAACFDAYIRHGLVEHPEGGVTLAIPKAQEAAIFRNLPSRWQRRHADLPVPVHLVAGADSYFSHKQFPQKARRKLGIPYSIVPGSHMFPLADPQATAAYIKTLIHN